MVDSWDICTTWNVHKEGGLMAITFFYIRAAGRRARSARRPAVQNVSVIAEGHGGGHASPIEAAGQWFY